jgi:uncharacterized membrane protein YqaE (UPF0057 family)
MQFFVSIILTVIFPPLAALFVRNSLVWFFVLLALTFLFYFPAVVLGVVLIYNYPEVRQLN